MKPIHPILKEYISLDIHNNRNIGCLGDPIDHGLNGLGNQLMSMMSNALLAIWFKRCLVIRSPLIRSTFILPHWIKSRFPHKPLHLPEGRLQIEQAFRFSTRSYETRWWYHKDHFKTEINSFFNTSHVEIAMHIVGEYLFSSPVAKVMRNVDFLLKKHNAHRWMAIHLRTFSDAQCPLGKQRFGDCGQCIPKKSLKCVNAMRTHIPALVFGDNARAINYVYRNNDLIEEELFARNTSKLVAESKITGQSALDPVIIWNIMRLAPRRVVSSSSTFSKSALLCSKTIRKKDILIDLRCKRVHVSDGKLFTCRHVKWTDLV